jgi:hypothetical protein
MSSEEDKPPAAEQAGIHLDFTEQRADILDHQVDNCPTCGGELEQGFGLAGGGYGAYGLCPTCERVIWKCQVED